MAGVRAGERFWLTLDTPADAAPGVYQGTIQVTAKNAPPAQMALAVRVIPLTLEEPPVERFMYFATMYYLGQAYLPRFDEELFWNAMRAEGWPEKQESSPTCSRGPVASCCEETWFAAS